MHVNYLPTRPDPDVEVSEADEARLDKVRQLMANRPPYQALQALTPQTIGYALTDSPVGQLVWIAERFAQWTDPATPVSDDRMLTDISLYWLTATAASSARLHRETPRRSRAVPGAGRRGGVRARHHAVGAAAGRAAVRHQALVGVRARRPFRRDGGAGAARRGRPGLLPDGIGARLDGLRFRPAGCWADDKQRNSSVPSTQRALSVRMAKRSSGASSYTA